MAFCINIQSAIAKTISTNQLDTADTITHNEFDLTLLGLGKANGNINEGIASARFRYGITNRLTASLSLFNDKPKMFIPNFIDSSIGDNFQLDFKYQLRRENLKSPACSIGINGLTNDFPEVYIVFTKHVTELIGFHCGAKLNTFGLSDMPRPYAAVEFNPVPNVVRLTADYQWNMQTLKAGVLGLGAYYSLCDDSEVGVLWFHINTFNAAEFNPFGENRINTRNFLAIQYISKF